MVVRSAVNIVATVGVIISLSWYYMLFAMTMNMSPVSTWDAIDLIMLFLMWAIMMAGMMLPSALPVILLVNKTNQQRISQQRAYTHTLYFITGYLIAWSFYSLLITGIQYWLHLNALLSPMMNSANNTFSSALLILAGVYQLTPLKAICLKHCRSPLSVITTQWQEGIKGAIRLGFSHGQYCIGCCWILMALLFVAGVMALKWIALLTFIVLLEKAVPKGDMLAKVLGVLLIIYGGYIACNSYIVM